jgi:hypothetical protein
MALWYGYMGAENLALNEAQKDAFVERLRGLGQRNNGANRFKMQLRPRLDNQAAIFEAVFEDSQLTPASIKQFLGSVFGVNPNTITNTNGVANFGNGTTIFSTFARGGTDYIRIAAFGKIAGTEEEQWLASWTECRIYLQLNSLAWDGE